MIVTIFDGWDNSHEVCGKNGGASFGGDISVPSSYTAQLTEL